LDPVSLLSCAVHYSVELTARELMLKSHTFPKPSLQHLHAIPSNGTISQRVEVGFQNCHRHSGCDFEGISWISCWLISKLLANE
jgi:hypothetical protein